MQAAKRSVSMIVAGTAAFLFLGVMYVWSVLRIELVKAFPQYTATQMSFCFTVMMISFCFGGFFGGKLIERKAPAASMRMSALLAIIGFMGASMMEFFPASAALWILYVFYAVIAGFGIGMGYNACMCNISPWFPNHIGLVTGIMLMGFGMSSLVFALVIDAICPFVGVFNVFRILGASVCAVVFTASFFVKKPLTASRQQTLADGGEEKCLTPIQMISRPSFWVYFLWNALCSAAGLLVINSAANIAAYFGLAASLGLIVSVFNGCGRPVVGAVVDKLGQFPGMLIMNVMLIAAAVMLIFADMSDKSALMFVGIILVGVVYGGGGTINSKVICELYGSRYFGTNHSISNFCVIISSLVGPLLSGVLQDNSGGGFLSTFYMLLVIGGVNLLLIFVLMFAVKCEGRRRIKKF